MPKDSKDPQENPSTCRTHEKAEDIALIEKKIDYIFGLLKRKSFTLLCLKAAVTCKHHLELLERNEADFDYFYEITKCFLTSKELGINVSRTVTIEPESGPPFLLYEICVSRGDQAVVVYRKYNDFKMLHKKYVPASEGLAPSGITRMPATSLSAEKRMKVRNVLITIIKEAKKNGIGNEIDSFLGLMTGVDSILQNAFRFGLLHLCLNEVPLEKGATFAASLSDSVVSLIAASLCKDIKSDTQNIYSTLQTQYNKGIKERTLSLYALGMQLEREFIYSSEELFSLSGEKLSKAKSHYVQFTEFFEAAKKRIVAITEKTISLTLDKNDFGKAEAAAELRTNIVNLIRDHSFSFRNLFSNISMLLICTPSLLTDQAYDKLRSLVVEISQSLVRGIQRFIFSDLSATSLPLFLSSWKQRRKNSDSETSMLKNSEQIIVDASIDTLRECDSKKSENEKSPLRSGGKSKGGSGAKKVESATTKTSDESLPKSSEGSLSKKSEDSFTKSSESETRRSPTLHQSRGGSPVRDVLLPIPSAQASKSHESDYKCSNALSSHRSPPATPTKERASQSPPRLKEKDGALRRQDEPMETTIALPREKGGNATDDSESQRSDAVVPQDSLSAAFSSSSSRGYGSKSVLSHDSGFPLTLPKSYASNGIREASSSSSSSSASLNRLLQAGALSIQSPTLKHLISVSKGNGYSDNREKYSAYLVRMAPLRLTVLARAFHPQSVVAIIRAARHAFSEPHESIKEMSNIFRDIQYNNNSVMQYVYTEVFKPTTSSPFPHKYLFLRSSEELLKELIEKRSRCVTNLIQLVYDKTNKLEKKLHASETSGKDAGKKSHLEDSSSLDKSKKDEKQKERKEEKLKEKDTSSQEKRKEKKDEKAKDAPLLEKRREKKEERNKDKDLYSQEKVHEKKEEKAKEKLKDDKKNDKIKEKAKDERKEEKGKEKEKSHDKEVDKEKERAHIIKEAVPIFLSELGEMVSHLLVFAVERLFSDVLQQELMTRIVKSKSLMTRLRSVVTEERERYGIAVYDELKAKSSKEKRKSKESKGVKEKGKEDAKDDVAAKQAASEEQKSVRCRYDYLIRALLEQVVRDAISNWISEETQKLYKEVMDIFTASVLPQKTKRHKKRK